MGSGSRRPARTGGLGAPLLLGAVALSWLGMYLHNVISLPDQTLSSPDTVFPSLVYVVLLVTWFTRLRSEATLALCIWAWLHLVGGGVLSAAPWVGESVEHLLAHALYTLLEIPLVVMTTRAVRSGRRGPGRRRPGPLPASSR
jgi:hypothetical protein